MPSLETIAIIPLVNAGLCPQCDAIVNTIRCPVCDSETLSVARAMSGERSSAERNQGGTSSDNL